MNEDDVKKFITARHVGEVEEVYGPEIVGGKNIWEIWVYGDDEYETRFLVEVEGAAPEYFDTFRALSVYLNKLFEDLSKQSNDSERRLREQSARAEQELKSQATGLEQEKARADIHLTKFRSYVAGFVLLTTIFILAYIMIFLREVGFGQQIIIAFVGIVSSGAAFFFGKWVPIKAHE